MRFKSNDTPGVMTELTAMRRQGTDGTPIDR